MEEYQFAFGVDANYVKYAGVVMTSIVLRHIGRPVCFHLLCDGVPLPEDQARLDDFTRLYKNTRIFIYDAHEALVKLPGLAGAAPARLNKTVFLRILMPMLVPRELTRIIYLDADTLCVGDVDPLWRMELSGHPLAAVSEDEEERSAKRLQLSQGRYLNAGFMVIDLEVWRAQHLTEKVLEVYRKYGKDYPLLEQDSLNKVLDGNFCAPAKQQICLMDAFNPLMIEISPENIFWHFLNEGKPWIRYADEQVSVPWWSAARRSLWYDLEPTEPWEARIALLAGRNAERCGQYQDAARYLGAAASRLMEFYLEKTGQRPKGTQLAVRKS